MCIRQHVKVILVKMLETQGAESTHKMRPTVFVLLLLFKETSHVNSCSYQHLAHEHFYQNGWRSSTCTLMQKHWNF